jgi:hypothetical protein
MTTISSNAPPAGSGPIPEKNPWYKDVALIREKILEDEVGYFDGHKSDILRIVNDNGFMNTFQKRAAHEYWHQVIYIQTNVKSKLGCGTPVVVKFYAPLDLENLDAEIVYDYKALGSEQDLIRAGEDYTYCLKQCYKMCYFI